MNIIERLLMKPVRHYYAAVVACPASRIWYHNLYQQLESGGEVPDLDTCRGKLMDEWIEPLFDKHQNDENRHAALWLELLQRRGHYNPGEIPHWANTVAAFSHRGWLATVGKLSRNQKIHSAELIPMFAGIHALEDLAIYRFQLMADLHREVDPEITSLLETIIMDEKFHLAYTRKAVLRLGAANDCIPYAKACLRSGTKAYMNYALSLMPYYTELLGRKGKGAEFSFWFLVFNQILKIYRWLRPDLSLPPAMPRHLALLVADLEKANGISGGEIPGKSGRAEREKLDLERKVAAGVSSQTIIVAPVV